MFGDTAKESTVRRMVFRSTAIGLLLILTASLPLSGAAAQDSRATASDLIGSFVFRPLGPAFNGGRVLDLAVDRNSRHTWYLAVASGAGSFGWSGCVGVKGYGSSVLLGTTITDAELEPTFPLPEEENFCCDCKACVGACPTEMFSDKEEMAFTLGGRE